LKENSNARLLLQLVFLNEAENIKILNWGLVPQLNSNIYIWRGRHLRAASPKYQLGLEIAKKSNFFKLAQNEALRALVAKILF